MQEVIELLDSLPSPEVPVDFDGPILAAVPYRAYREMEPLRRERVPVYLEENFLPTAIRARGTRVAGLAIAGCAVIGLATSWFPNGASFIAIAGLVPEALVRLQQLARKLGLSDQRSESG
jgi:hypothetical protein